MRRILKEPLLHFLILGALLFVAFGRADDPGETDKQIVVSRGRIEQLSRIFIKTWQRAPTRQELQGLVDDFVLEEIYYRQAVAMGIDRDDTVVRRRLRQKFEFLTDDMAAIAEPSQEELAAYLAANEVYFRSPTTYTFQQVYLNPERYGANMERAAAERLTTLRNGAAPEGDSGLLPTSFEQVPPLEVDGRFGAGFSQALDGLPLDTWEGPIESGLGLHLVRVHERREGTLPELSQIRPVVEREWANARRLAYRNEVNERLLQEYEVRIEWPSEQAEPRGAE